MVMVKFEIIESSLWPESEPKSQFSSSLPQEMLNRLTELADRIKRDKALLIRMALNTLFNLDPSDQDKALMEYYRRKPSGSPRAFTTSLAGSQKEMIGRLAEAWHRSKADVTRAAIFTLLDVAPERLEAMVMDYLSEGDQNETFQEVGHA